MMMMMMMMIIINTLVNQNLQNAEHVCSLTFGNMLFQNPF